MILNNIKYIDIKKIFDEQSIVFSSELKDNDLFEHIKPISNASSKDLTFFSNNKYLNDLKTTNAKACLINSDYVKHLTGHCKPIIVEDPYFALACLSSLFSNTIKKSNGIISKNINKNVNCRIHKNVQIDDFCFIDNETEIFEEVIIGPNCKIGPNVKIHNNCIIHNGVSISNAIIRENCEIQSGAVIGGSGFGFEEKSKRPIYHFGNVIINKNSVIGSNTTIDRAVFDSTTIGEFSHIDNLVQIAHNVIIGKHAIIAAQVGIAGSTSIGDFVKIGGQSGISGHLKIGNNVSIAGKSGVTKNIDDDKVVAGFPAKDIGEWKRQIIKMSKI